MAYQLTQSGAEVQEILDAAANLADILTPKIINCTLSSSFKAYGDAAGNTPTLRVCGGSVFLRGVVAPTADLDAGATTDICTFDSQYAPKNDVYVLCQGSGTAVWLLRVYPSGKATAQRYRVTDGSNASAVIKSSYWMPFAASWVI